MNSVKPPPGSLKKRENSPRKKNIPKDAASKINEIEFFLYLETVCKDEASDDYTIDGCGV